MEVFIETLVRKQQTGKDLALKLLITFASAILSVVGFMLLLSIQFLSFLAILAPVGIIYGAWVLIRNFNVEYEYILTNSDLDVDKIVAQSRRKRLTTVDLKQIELFAPANEENRREFENSAFKKINASTGDAASTYFIKFPGKEGTTVLLFNPDDRIIKGARQFSPSKVIEA
jgi:hypothetical protein